ncbi:hypothetical protein SAMN02745912_02991 [Paramaledivibacter caminithermalis DSM 15212]|jgi:hypothetical protein|uniref:Uncharacterized protein n=2 Tax=Paramaledivibacter TaxID=1884934 RepID=A0A1M6RJM8_PARC5|nr:hypothetical protein SAMN02745912_02991 [Paramaledivibacter caminithermalis DSM 15212]
MEIIQDKLYIGSSPIDSDYNQDLVTVNIDSWKIEYIKLNNSKKVIPAGPVLDIIKYNNMLHLVHYGGLVTILDIESYKINKILMIPQHTISVKVDGEKAFILSQSGEKGQDALVGIYSFPEWKLENKWVVEKIRETKQQSIYLNKLDLKNNK